MRKVFFIAVLAALLVSVAIQLRLSDTFDPAGPVFPTHAIVASGQMWQLEIANTDALRSLGLGERDSLPREKGMLFLYGQPGRYGFWMHGMRFPLDMVFLSQGEIIFIERGIQPGDPKIVMPPTPVDQVLELNSGEADDLETGDQIWYWRSF